MINFYKYIRDKEVPTLFSHQNTALSFIKELDYFALFCEQGTGKSKIVLEKLWDLWNGGKVNGAIIISPNAVIDQWINEQVTEHYPSSRVNTLIWKDEGEKTFNSLFEKYIKDKENLFIFSINVESFQATRVLMYVRLMIEARKLFVVIDESTRIKNGRRKPARGHRGGAKRTNTILDLFESVQYKAIMTGTPTPNSPFDLWSQFEFLKKDFFGMDYFYFTHHHGIMLQKTGAGNRSYRTVLDEKTFNMVKYRISKLEVINSQKLEEIADNFGMKLKDVILIRSMEKFGSYKNLKELKEKISRVTFSIKKQDCLDLPDKVYEKLYCQMGKEQKRIYESLKKDMLAQYEDKEISVTNKMVLTLRLQMVTGGLFPYATNELKVDKDGEEFWDQGFQYQLIQDSSKIKVLLEDLEEVPDYTKIIIWARFRGEIDYIVSALQEQGYSCDKFYGGSSSEVIDKFKHQDLKILVSSQLKGGEGQNLQMSTLQYFYSNSFKADSRLQAEDRSHRIGQTNKVLYKDLICKGTVDERVYEVLKRKESLIDYFRTNSIKEFLQ